MSSAGGSLADYKEDVTPETKAFAAKMFVWLLFINGVGFNLSSVMQTVTNKLNTMIEGGDYVAAPAIEQNTLMLASLQDNQNQILAMLQKQAVQIQKNTELAHESKS